MTGTFPSISAHTQTIAIIGDPIEHSLTPRIQNAALREVGADAVNVAFRVPKESLETAIHGAQALGLRGLMVTIPHKEAIIPLCDELHASARLMGAANLLQFTSDGRIVGHSSDGWAALKSLEEEGVEYKGKNILLLGGGGAARSLALTFADAGAGRIWLLNRTVERAERIASEVANLGVPVTAAGTEDASIRNAIEAADLVVNTTSVGMTPNIADTPLDAQYLRPGLAVYDIVYNPLETRLLREAREAGARPVDGLGMLIYTNVYATQTCLGVETSAATMRAEAMRAFGL